MVKHVKLLFLFLMLSASCTRTKSTSSNISAKNMTIKPVAIPHQEPSDHIESLPFGSKILATFQFSPNWVSSNRDSVTKHDLTMNDRFNDVDKFYELLVRKKVIKKPIINKLEYIRMNYPYQFKDSITNSVDSIRYELPDMGPYKCYYSQLEGHHIKPAKFEDSEEWCNRAGNLILYDPKTHIAKVINVFFAAECWVETDHRFFYIDKNKLIYIYNIHGDEESSDFKKEFIINVKKNGEVVLRKL